MHARNAAILDCKQKNLIKGNYNIKSLNLIFDVLR
jgi:hypothetical protein